MSAYRRYTDEHISRANSVDLVDYAASQGYEVKRLGNDYKLPGHGGLLIKSDRRTWWHGITEKGGGPIQFVMFVKNIPWADAVTELINEKFHAVPVSANTAQSIQRPELVLPERAADYRRLFAYLCKTRCLDSQIVSEFVHKHKLYQDTRGNCVFVTYDGGKPVYASLRSTLSNNTFRGDIAGSRKIGWGCGRKSNDTLCVCESPIDLMSFMSFRKRTVPDVYNFNYISVGGTSFSPLLRCLDKNPQIKRVVICTDNDEAGIAFYRLNRPKLEMMGYKVCLVRPDGKDWNEDLCYIVRAEARAEEQDDPER